MPSVAQGDTTTSAKEKTNNARSLDQQNRSNSAKQKSRKVCDSVLHVPHFRAAAGLYSD